MTNEQADCLATLSRAKVPYAIKTTYVDGAPGPRTLMPITITKRDRFYRLNGKVVSRNVAAWAARVGIARA